MASSNLHRGAPAVPGNIQFLDFAPDAPPNTPGAILAAGNLYPTVRGWRAYPTLVEISDDALPGLALGGFATALGASNIVVVVGTATQLYLYQSNAWVSQGLTLGSADRWRFDQYGGLVIAANGVDGLQAYNGSGTFAALGGSPPVASIVQASNYSLFAIEPNSNDWWSTLSATIWTPSIATQTVTGSLDKTQGIITAAHKLRDGMAIYKNKSLYFSQFVGPPFYWDFQIVSAQIGAPSQEAVANLGDVQMWPGNDDWYAFDGRSLTRIPNSLKEWFFANVDGLHLDKIAARWDQKKSLVFWHFPSYNASPAGTLDSWICLNVRTGKWGCSEAAYTTAVDIPIFSAIETGALTYDTLTALNPTYADFDGSMYGDYVSQSIEVSGAIRMSDRKLALYNGSAGAWMLTSHDFGDYYNKFQVTRVRPRFLVKPSSATLRPLNQNNEAGIASTEGPATTISAFGNFDLQNTARMQRFRINSSNDAEISGMDVLVDYAGEQ